MARPAATSLAVLLALSSMAGLWRAGLDGPGSDFRNVWLVPRFVAQRAAPSLYSPEGRSLAAASFQAQATAPDAPSHLRLATFYQALFPTGTPFFYTAFHWLLRGGYEFDYRLFQLLSLAAFAIGLLCIARLVGLGWAPALLALAALGETYEPALSDARVANVNRLLVGGMALSLWLRHGRAGPRSDFAEGTALGVLVAFKPVLAGGLLFTAGWRLWSRRGREAARELAGAGAGILMAALASSFFFGTVRCWAEWAAQLGPTLRMPDWDVANGNYAPSALLRELHAPAWPIPAAALLLLLGLVVVVGRTRHLAPPAGRETAAEDTLALSLGVAALCVVADLVWLHYFTLFGPAAIVLLRPRHGPLARRRAVLFAAAAALGILLLSLSPAIRLLALTDARAYAALALSGAAVLTVAALLDLASRRPDFTALSAAIAGGGPR
jgi:hypothetical protein